MGKYTEEVAWAMNQLNEANDYVQYIFQALADSPSDMLKYYLTDPKTVITACYPDAQERFKDEYVLTKLMKASKVVYQIVLELYEYYKRDLYELLVNMMTIRFLLYGVPVKTKRINLEVPIEHRQN